MTPLELRGNIVIQGSFNLQAIQQSAPPIPIGGGGGPNTGGGAEDVKLNQDRVVQVL